MRRFTLTGSAESARIFKNDKHTGPVRGLDFNPIQKNLLLTGAVKAEVCHIPTIFADAQLFIFDLNNPTNPIPPGSTSNKLGEITSLQWNPTVSRVFAASSSSGYTSVWDLKASKEIVSLQYGGGAAKGMENAGGRMDLQMGKRRGMSDVCWHPDQATRLITASEDDESPIIMLWDLRNTRAPERILSGHQKGVLSVAWCPYDPDLLLSCGKDNRTLCWNPQTGDIVAELPSSNDWAFQTSWCPRNPDLIATASFDGHIGVYSLQTTHEAEPAKPKFSETATADDIFGALGDDDEVEATANVMSLTQPPKWLKRPVSATFGFSGLLASTSNLPAASGKHQSGVVHLRKVVTESSIIDRAKALDAASGDKEKLSEFCSQQEGSAWQGLRTLFTASSKQELLQLMGFSKEDVVKQVEEMIKTLPGGQLASAPTEKADAVDLSEPEKDVADGAETPTATSEASVPNSVTDLFDQGPGTPNASADFFSSMPASNPLRNPALDSIIPHKPDVAESSVAATIGGSRASSVRSENIKENTFHIYPKPENGIDRLITQALVLGDFQSAVNLCLASERFADALLLAVRGGPELLQFTQKAYFARQTASLPFLRVFQSIVTEDLADIVQNADLSEWKAIFAVVCTFSREGDLNNLADQLGQRLQFKWQVMSGSSAPEAKAAAKSAREDATLCFLAARRLEKVVGVWVQEMKEEESASTDTKYTAHAQALQTFIEKVAVFTAATSYVDDDLMDPTENAQTAESGARTYRLASLYDRFYEYADLLATQGLVDMAAKYVQMTPTDYKGTGAAGSELDKARDRLLQAAGASRAGPSKSGAFTAQQSRPNAYAQQSQTYAAPPSAYDASPARPSNVAPSVPPPAPSFDYGAYAPTQLYQTPNQYATNGYGPSDPQPQGYGVPTSQYGAPQQNQYSAPPAPLAPPPRANNASSTTSPTPGAQRRDVGGWNDAPQFAPPKRPLSAAKDGRAAPIMSPFPMSSDPSLQPPSMGPPQGLPQGPPQGPPHGPPQGQPGMLPPPPKGAPRPPSAQAVARGQFEPTQQAPSRPPPQAPPRGSPLRSGPPPPNAAGVLSGPPPSALGVPPPGVIAGQPPRALSPLGPAGRQASPMMAQMRSAVPRTQPMSPPGQRMGGPPPPGRRESQTAPVASPPPVPTPPPSKPVHGESSL